jgi:predicted hydrocarbon binding protein
MKGIIFNLLEQFITERFGDEMYEKILSECNLKTEEPFVGPGSYPEEDLMALVDKVVEKMGVPLPEALRAFGRFCLPKLAERFPEFLTPHKHPKAFLKTIDSVVHLEVKKLYSDAEPPSFAYDDPSPERLIIRYRSKRRLCQFMEGLIEGVADYYRSPIKYKQTSCMLEGSEVCVFELTF